jgi:hypothetical protein
LRKYILYILVVLATLSSCQTSNVLSNSKYSARKSSPTGKYRNPTMFSRANPFQGRAKARLQKSKRKKLKLFKRKHQQSGAKRKSKKPGRTFGMKRQLSRRRLNSSGSRVKSGGGGGKKNKNLFKTKKK